MDRIEKTQGRQEIYDFLVSENERIRDKIDWKDSLLRFSETANMCAIALTGIKWIISYREKELEQKGKRTPGTILKQKIKKDLYNLRSQMENNPKADILYFPGCEWVKGSFEDYHAIIGIETIIKSGFKPVDNLKDNLDYAVHCALSLRGVFYSLSGKDVIPKDIVFLLSDFLNDLINKTYDLSKNIDERERKGDRNSLNASKYTPAKIKDCKKHDKYPQLEQLIKSCQDVPTQTEVASINKILSIIVGTKNKVTLRRYRHIFFKEIKR